MVYLENINLHAFFSKTILDFEMPEREPLTAFFCTNK